MNKKNIHVVGAVIWQDGKILCAQRGATKTLAYKWEFPGGKIEQGETPEAALKREILEEMNCEIVVGERVEHTVYEYEFGIVHLTTFHCALVSGNLTLTEHIDVKWLEPENLHTLDWAPADIPAIEKLSQSVTP
ncbi:(deoxy)nucleoside triphosphate pyrophosphohydrolase [Bhargavaea massiliensis]|uniref:(deoxy)nucleoside triphosphate pyrophosphohydrolase n=1 Tax=Bhargavaea massiliensis TaxID=2697500 RepID=UPI001F22EC94|nr:(deoxy)nucleoside triphosphate pyrophosphohydrolase [Bhargavaea massiliensis]